MTESSQDTFIRALAMLSSLRENLGETTGIPSETYVREFHDVLDRLEGVKVDVSQFRIPDSEVKPMMTSFNTLSGERTYSKEKYVERPLLLTKLDATIKYIVMLIPDKARKIGFYTPHSQ